MFYKFVATAIFSLIFSSNVFAQDSYSCTGPSLLALKNINIGALDKKKLEANFARAMGGADVYAYLAGDEIKVITATFESNAGKADMNFYLQSRDNYLMEYHIVQNSNFFGEPDSVVLTDEKSYYHVCDGALLAPAFGGIINEEIYDNMKLVLEVILTEEEIK